MKYHNKPIVIDGIYGINILDATKTNFENSFQNPLTEF